MLTDLQKTWVKQATGQEHHNWSEVEEKLFTGIRKWESIEEAIPRIFGPQGHHVDLETWFAKLRTKNGFRVLSYTDRFTIENLVHQELNRARQG